LLNDTQTPERSFLRICPALLLLVPPCQRQTLKRLLHPAGFENLVDSLQLLLPLPKLDWAHDGGDVAHQVLLFGNQFGERENSRLGGHSPS
jgi:hypothetical protein